MHTTYRLRLYGKMCDLTYGTSPCVATLTGDDPTGTAKCFNTRASCQDPDNYSESDRTYSFASVPTAGHRHMIKSVAIQSGAIAPEGMGGYAKCTVKLIDSIAADTTADDPYGRRTDAGTYWGRLIARQPGMGGWDAEVDLIDGDTGSLVLRSRWRIDAVDDPVDGMVTLHLASPDKDELDILYPITSTGVPIYTPDRNDPNLPPTANPYFYREQLPETHPSYPLPDEWLLPSDWTEGETYVRAGSEICGVTRGSSPDTTLAFMSPRAQFGTDQEDHADGTVFQKCAFVEGQIGASLKGMLTEAGIPDSRIDSASFASYDTSINNTGRVKRIFSRQVALRDAMAEICLIGQCCVIWDVFAQKYKLAGESAWSEAERELDDCDLVAGTFKIRRLPDRQMTRGAIEYFTTNPTDDRSFAQLEENVNEAIEEIYGGPHEKKFVSPALGYGTESAPAALRNTASTTLSRAIIRYGEMPAEITCEVTGAAMGGLSIGRVYDVAFPTSFQGFDGTSAPWKCMLTEMSISREGASRRCRFLKIAPGIPALLNGDHIVETGLQYQYSLWNEMGSPTQAVTRNVIIPAGAICYSDDPVAGGFIINGFREGSVLNILCEAGAHILGGGGAGGDPTATNQHGWLPAAHGGDGGPAVEIWGNSITVNFVNYGNIWPGGGGGGAGAPQYRSPIPNINDPPGQFFMRGGHGGSGRNVSEDAPLGFWQSPGRTTGQTEWGQNADGFTIIFRQSGDGGFGGGYGSPGRDGDDAISNVAGPYLPNTRGPADGGDAGVPFYRYGQLQTFNLENYGSILNLTA